MSKGSKLGSVDSAGVIAWETKSELKGTAEM